MIGGETNMDRDEGKGIRSKGAKIDIFKTILTKKIFNTCIIKNTFDILSCRFCLLFFFFLNSHVSPCFHFLAILLITNSAHITSQYW